MKRTMLALALLSVATAAHAENGVLPMAAKPEDVGLSSAQLKRLEEVTQKHVDSGLVPGAVMLVARHGKIAWMSVLGKRDPAAGDAMKPDSIFRIYSMTKPIVSVAVMQMVEEGRLQVSDPVSKFIPEIGKMKVGSEKIVDGRAVLQLSDPERAMTVQDLLRHTSGLTYGAPGANQLKQSYLDLNVNDRNQTVAEMADKLAKLSLVYQPGTTWEYSMSTDVLGRVVEVASGMPLDKFIEERITKPLKMGETGFEVGPDKKARGDKPMKEGPKNELPSITSTSRPNTSVDTPYSQRVPGENFSAKVESLATNSSLLMARLPILAST